jgi:hypothetical protein
MKFLSLSSVTLLLAVVITSFSVIENRKSFADAPIEGRWDLTIDEDGKMVPSWLEVQHSGLSTLVGYFVGTGGSARPISKVNFTDGKMSFTIPPQWETGSDLVVEGTLHGDKMTGTIVMPTGKKHNWTAVRAPALIREKAPVWGAPIKIFNGRNLDGWKAMGENQWIAEGGVLRSPKSGANLVTEQKFNDFKLHIEFRCPKGSNSGVYLRGRYEVQITDSKGLPPASGQLGGIYGFIKPSENMAKDAGQWQSFDVTIVGRMVTLMVNGKTVITNQEIPGITGGAIDSNESEPGPLMIQGDHGPIEYRNIVITPAK